MLKKIRCYRRNGTGGDKFYYARVIAEGQRRESDQEHINMIIFKSCDNAGQDTGNPYRK